MSPAPKYKSVLVAWSLERYARHTQTVNLYAPLTLRFGLTHGRPCPQVWLLVLHLACDALADDFFPPLRGGHGAVSALQRRGHTKKMGGKQ